MSARAVSEKAARLLAVPRVGCHNDLGTAAIGCHGQAQRGHVLDWPRRARSPFHLNRASGTISRTCRNAVGDDTIARTGPTNAQSRNIPTKHAILAERVG